jgi:hypothetical protein
LAHFAGHPGNLVAGSDRPRCGTLGWTWIETTFDFDEPLGEISKRLDFRELRSRIL